MVAEPATLPRDHRARLNEDQNVPPAGLGARQPRPEKTIGDLDPRSRGMSLVDGEPVTQSKDLQMQGGSRTEAGAAESDEREEDSRREGKKLPHRWHKPGTSWNRGRAVEQS